MARQNARRKPSSFAEKLVHGGSERVLLELADIANDCRSDELTDLDIKRLLLKKQVLQAIQAALAESETGEKVDKLLASNARLEQAIAETQGAGAGRKDTAAPWSSPNSTSAH